MYIDKLDDIIDKYNNTYYRTIKIKPTDIKKTLLTLISKIIITILNLKLVIMWKYQNRKIIFVESYTPIGQKKFLWLNKLKILYHGHMSQKTLMVQKLLERFIKRMLKQTEQILREKCPYLDFFGPYFPSFGLNAERCRVEKVTKKKCKQLYVKWKDYDN